LAGSTAKAAVGLAAGRHLSELGLSQPVIELVSGGSQAMVFAKVKITVCVLMVGVAAVVGVATGQSGPGAGQPPAAWKAVTPGTPPGPKDPAAAPEPADANVWENQSLELGDTGFVAAAGPWGTKNPVHYSVAVHRRYPDGTEGVHFDTKLKVATLPTGFVTRPVKEIVTFDPSLRLVTFDLGSGQEVRYKLPAASARQADDEAHYLRRAVEFMRRSQGGPNDNKALPGDAGNTRALIEALQLQGLIPGGADGTSSKLGRPVTEVVRIVEVDLTKGRATVARTALVTEPPVRDVDAGGGRKGTVREKAGAEAERAVGDEFEIKQWRLADRRGKEVDWAQAKGKVVMLHRDRQLPDRAVLQMLSEDALILYRRD
jgi:hypothetical protein